MSVSEPLVQLEALCNFCERVESEVVGASDEPPMPIEDALALLTRLLASEVRSLSLLCLLYCFLELPFILLTTCGR